ncbi:alpha-2-macroglobulin family protein [Roseovarius aestuariivivens]|uniref:alpha-2-macroglobulin family protein n=1 Tax=Roseovarius aestuariivivens TaxID=1888910 RepID=UPI001081A250|nr:alpha-2-macroglobulin family protein [Roseovarius aestuariivivens]
MLRHSFVALILLCSLFSANLAIAQTAVPDRREVVTRNVDFYGADLDPLFDTTLEACRTACFANPACSAYTFNSRSNACFSKRGISERQPYEGAISAELFPTDTRVLAQAEARRGDLAFLSDADIAQARDLALGIGARHPGGQWDQGAMLAAARERLTQNDYLNAMRWTGAAVALSDAADQWAEYARLSLLIETQNNAEKSRYARQALQAAINAYLRAPNDPLRATALMITGEALERMGRGRDLIRALRLAEEIQPRADVVAALEAANGKYGFRITTHRSDNETASPRICAEFSEPLIKAGTDYTPFVRLPDPGLVVQAEGGQICIGGVEHGERYRITFRRGLPAASGERLIKDVEISQYIRDRSPSAGFGSRAYVLPKAGNAALPIETVNLNEVDLLLRRASDRNLLRTLQDGYFGRPLSAYEEREFSSEIAEEVWRGTGAVQNELNRTMTTRLPMGDILSDLNPGIYALTARVPGVDTYDDAGSTQWFILTDLGLTTFKGTDGLHVIVRGLGDAQPRKDITLDLLSRANRVIASQTTDAKGHATFAPGLLRGTDGASPAMIVAKADNDDLAFLSLTDPAFDLSDRGVEGRPPAPPVDVFLATDRGAYRPGETIHATALARDEQAAAIERLPLTAVLTRPDGVEYLRRLSSEDVAGGHVFALPVAATAPRGGWTLDIFGEPEAAPLVSRTVVVEDFLPERIDFEMALPDGPIRPGDTAPLRVEARYLFGAPGAGLEADGTVRLTPLTELDAFPGYRFGRHDALVSAISTYLDGGETDNDGKLSLSVPLPIPAVADRPFEAEVILAMKEGSGRPVERRLRRDLAPAGPMIGIKPRFDGVVSEGAEAAFEIIGVAPDLTPQQMEVSWTLNRISTRYQWYEEYGNWNWEPITTRKQVATGTGTTGQVPLALDERVDWGRYELLVERTGPDYVASSVEFYAGWYAPADASSTPDTLELSLDMPAYSPGDTAELRLVPRYAGTALIGVMSNRVITMEAVEVVEGENLVPLEVTEDWGAGAYVTAQVIRPMNKDEGRNPARALGLSYARIAPGTKQLSVRIEAPQIGTPRGPLDVGLTVDGIAEGETAFVTLAAVDLGILNLTGFESPNPSAHYFGQRRLGVEIRDLYGRLINGMTGAEGRVRSGGDAGNRVGTQAPRPTEELVAFFSGPVAVGPDGRAALSFDIPDFNGTVRLMAVAWSPSAVGQATQDTILRDPVVMTASLPRFLSPGDESSLLLEIVHADGSAGRTGLDVSSEGLSLLGPVPSGLDLAEGEKLTLRLPIRAGDTADQSLRIALTTPDGQQLTKNLILGVRANDPAIATTRRFTLAAGDSVSLGSDIFAGLRQGTGQAVLSAGALAKLDVPGLLTSLDRYPYGCTEQIVSRGLPLLYFNGVAGAMGLADETQIAASIDQSIARVLTRQSAGGGFGLWRADSGDFWLDAYVTDFLSRARNEGFKVPQQAYAMALDNLRNRVNYAPDFDEGGEDIAYALMVLARERVARMGDLRYYADVKANGLGTPLALAQLGAALAAYGDQTRADRMFAMALHRIINNNSPESHHWRADYGTQRRDRAGLLTLAAEANSDVVDLSALAGTLGADAPHLSTQEQAWTLLAAKALLRAPSAATLTLDGTPITGPLVHRFTADGPTKTLGNTGARPVEITLTTIGVPTVAPEAGGYGYAIERAYYDLEGARIDLGAVPTGSRLVTVLTVRPFERGEARLMIDDPLPAGFEIDNPALLRSGDIRALDWLKTTEARHTEFRAERFLAAVDWRSDDPFQLAYIVRAVSPGSYHHPAASVEDMYRPQYRARTATGRMEVVE